MNSGKTARDQFAVSPFTGSHVKKIWGHRDGRTIFECQDTHAIFFDRDSLKRGQYQHYYPYLDRFNDAQFKWELKIRKHNYKKQFDVMERLAPGNKLVDIGAGPGYLCRVALDEGWDAYGVEVSDKAVKYGIEKFKVKYRELDGFSSGALDVVTCHHVLEHLCEPMEFLATVREKLKKQGLLVLHVPHQQPLTFMIKDMLTNWIGKREQTNCALYGNEHISGFTKTSLRNVVELAGFSTHFVCSADMWTKYYDPFFLRCYIMRGRWAGLIKRFARHSIDSVGIPFGLADWVVGYFYKP